MPTFVARFRVPIVGLGGASLVVALVAGCGQGADEIEVVDVTSTGTLTQIVDGTFSGAEMPSASGVPAATLTGTVYEVSQTASDERYSGTGEVHLDRCDFTYTEADDTTVGQCTSTDTITNDGGSWEGTSTGTTTWVGSGPHYHVFTHDFVGTGDYEGLRFTGVAEWTVASTTTTGQIAPIE